MSTVVPNTEFEVIPLTGQIGAEIRGVQLSAEQDEAQIRAIRQALLEHKVIFFRGQNHLDDLTHEAFARRFGPLYVHPTVSARNATNAIFELDSAFGGGRANAWHTDITFVDAYPQISILRAVVIPSAGGDTVWANTANAYRTLPQELRDLADKLWALHTNDFDYGVYQDEHPEQEIEFHQKVFIQRLYEAEHPVVRVHPETAERTLVLGQFVKRIVGFSSSDSRRLVSILQDHITRLENTVRWKWAEGDVAIWDNRATQHYAINDYGDKRRVVRRVTIAGDVPVSVDGKKSVLRKNGVANNASLA
ncbi:TauD/TfdA dioxygenase family protein [Alicyclobacillus acidoterrestris]|uniref:Alpha-ketoglutarate-dependent sulfate ester dioxygenase n=1 Tax=Alicyclobacillus acidoterrestris (strain ATCC 49025 / DSM 3922 / CIP 106132 / NCIMB 13137 / GD3B) TaxID=1356854 RepID=T0BLB3_ALIAG|nr:TauD/TfdA family dioxygenase [Alicyclobacillus acidoterrestris]EPZ41345.1 hypothetical protein N007_17185 [Alicyclobacillus acidoterrestris ATCC 49025]UNO47681.1 TauD/TfdA family dioxygenase [Alicyclobacillus acidoterrestris]